MRLVMVAVVVCGCGGGWDSGSDPVNGECTFSYISEPGYVEGENGDVNHLLYEPGQQPLCMDTLGVVKVTPPGGNGEGVVVIVSHPMGYHWENGRVYITDTGVILPRYAPGFEPENQIRVLGWGKTADGQDTVRLWMKWLPYFAQF